MERSNFLVSIHHQENHSWQGTIKWLDTGKILHFRSQLELMQLMMEAAKQHEQTDTDLRTWESETYIKVVK